MKTQVCIIGGGPSGLLRFVDACHRRGLGVLLDAVFNHLGPSGNYLPKFGPYLTVGRTPWGEAINIAAADSDPVRRYIIDCALRWMRDFGIDGLRQAVALAAGRCRLEASGDLGAVSRFLYEVETDPMALKVQSVEITARDNEGRQMALGMQLSGLVSVPETEKRQR